MIHAYRYRENGLAIMRYYGALLNLFHVINIISINASFIDGARIVSRLK